MTRRARLLALATTTALAAALTPFAGTAQAVTTSPVLPSAADVLTLPSPTTTSTAADRKLPSSHLTIGVRDRLLTTGKLAWLPSTGVPFDSAYQYVSGTGPGTKGDYHVSTMVAFAQKSQLTGVLPVLSYFRINGNYKGALSAPAACTATCTRGDTAKRNLDHLNDPSFMQPYFTHLVESFRQLDAKYTGQFLMHVEPDLSGYAQQLSIDRVRCAEDCIPGVPADDPSGVRAAVASSGITQLSGFPNTLQGFFSAVLHLRDLYAPRVSLAYHVSNWATARTGTVSGANDMSNSISVGTKPVDAAALGARVARFAAMNGATTAAVSRPGPATSRYDVLFNDVLDNDAGYFATETGQPGYWWDSENIDVPNFARWETYLGAITAATGLPATVWQVPLGNTVFKVSNNTRATTRTTVSSTSSTTSRSSGPSASTASSSAQARRAPGRATTGSTSRTTAAPSARRSGATPRRSAARCATRSSRTTTAATCGSALRPTWRTRCRSGSAHSGRWCWAQTRRAVGIADPGRRSTPEG